MTDEKHAEKRKEQNRRAVDRYKMNHPELVKERARKYRERMKIEQPEKYKQGLECLKKWKMDNPGRDKERNRRWKLNHPDKRSLVINNWKKKHPEKRKEYAERWAAKNPNYYSNYRKRNTDKQRLAVKRYELRHPEIRVIRHAVSHMLEYTNMPKNAHSRKYIGCCSGFLKNHIEEQFQPGMTWVNYGTEWHIDHIIPLSWFPFRDDPSLIYVASHWTNLRPLGAKENMAKGNRHAA